MSTRALSRSRAALVATAALALPLSAVTAGTAAAPLYTVQGLTFTVTTAADSGGGMQQCTIVGDLYKPAAASPTHRVPAILTTNGFGGSKDDQAGLGRLAASHGYAVLSYSGLGFGGSGCKISLDDPDFDGVAGSQLVSFLGGDAGIAENGAGDAVSIDFVQLDQRGHDGVHHAHDPRVGMIGGSYGGQIQFAIASVDPRLDTIITWNDLAYSLAPNNTALTRGVTYRDDTPGTEKLDWVSAFFGLGIVDGLQGAQVDPSRLVGCPNFRNEACVAKAELDAGGFATQDVIDFARHASVTSYMRKIRIPTLLAQGQADTLFNLNEAAATYDALRRQGTPVKMIWQSWGHSHGDAAKGEYSSGADALTTYEGKRFFAWFDHYLKGKDVDTGPRFAYYRDWVPFSGSGADAVQYGHAKDFPVGQGQTLYLSGSDKLVRGVSNLRKGSASYTNPGGSVPTSYSETSAVQGSQIPDESTPPSDLPGTFAAWSSPALAQNLDVVGIPTAHVHVSAPTTDGSVPATQLLFFAKIYDVAPDGSVDLVHRLISPVRVKDTSSAVNVTMPGIVHRFRKGHRIEFVMAATDAAYKNAYPVQPVTVSTDPKAPSWVRLPVVAGTTAAAPTTGGAAGEQGAASSGGAGAASGSTLPNTGGSTLAPAIGAGVIGLGLALVALRRRRPERWR